MFVKLNETDFNKYIDYIYSLALDPKCSGYPTYTDGVKTKDDFITRSYKAFSRDNEDILLYLYKGNVSGWIHYYHIPEDRYLDTCSFCIAEGLSEAIKEFVSFAKEKFSGCTLYLGFPKENVEATSTLKKLNFTCIEESFNNIFDLSNFALQPINPNILVIDKENFKLFRTLHDQHKDMYWDSDHLLADIDQWRILLFMLNGTPYSAIYYTLDKELAEIFGVDFLNEYDSDIFQELLTAALSSAKNDSTQYMVFFSDNQEQKDALKVGFRCVGEYVCYSSVL